MFSSILKTSKIIPIYNKGSKLECSNYRPISLLSNIDRILERLMYNRLTGLDTGFCIKMDIKNLKKVKMKQNISQIKKKKQCFILNKYIT